MTNKEVKLIRLYTGLTQKTFADQCGLAEGTIAKIEAGLIGVSDVTRAKVLRKFNISDPEYISFVRQMKATETGDNEVKSE